MNRMIVIVASIWCMNNVYGMEQEEYVLTKKRKIDRVPATINNDQKPYYYKVLCPQEDCNEVVSVKKTQKELNVLRMSLDKHFVLSHALNNEQIKQKGDYVGDNHWVVTREQIKKSYIHAECKHCDKLFCSDNNFNNNRDIKDFFTRHLKTCTKKKRAVDQEVTLINKNKQVKTYGLACTAAHCIFSCRSVDLEYIKRIMIKHSQIKHKESDFKMGDIKEELENIDTLYGKTFLIMCLEPLCSTIIYDKSHKKSLRESFVRHLKFKHKIKSVKVINNEILNYCNNVMIEKPLSYNADEKKIKSLTCIACKESTKADCEAFLSKHNYLHHRKDEICVIDNFLIRTAVASMREII